MNQEELSALRRKGYKLRGGVKIILRLQAEENRIRGIDLWNVRDDDIHELRNPMTREKKNILTRYLSSNLACARGRAFFGIQAQIFALPGLFFALFLGFEGTRRKILMIDARPNTPFWTLYPKRNPSPSGGVGPCNWAVEAAVQRYYSPSGC